MIDLTTSNAPIEVLIVDDHSMFASGLATLLAAEVDIQVIGTAGNAAEAEEACQRRVPDVVLMDFGLPDMNGAHATERIRALHPTAKVVMLTSLVDDSTVLAGVEAGCSGYVTKDQDLENVVAAIRAAYAGESVISPAMLARLLPRLRKTEQDPVGSDLTARELEVLELFVEGLSNKAIGERLFISVNTVRTHVQNVLTKLRAHSKLEATVIAARLGLIRFGE
jgi:DNA-binding NarL/FixJ family response regulator